MTLQSSSIQIVKREEKETKLTQYILGEIAAGRVDLNGEWTVISLSMQSPVVCALRQVIRDLGSANELDLHILLMERPGSIREKTGLGAVNTANLRLAQNTRLLDAHEQLVLGSQSAWIGDCMRRNPRERDAYETYGRNDSQLAERSTVSFNRLWNGAKPISSGWRPTTQSSLDVIASANASDKSGPLVAATSRH